MIKIRGVVNITSSTRNVNIHDSTITQRRIAILRRV